MIEVLLNCVFFVTHVKITLFTNFDVDCIRIADVTYVSNFEILQSLKVKLPINLLGVIIWKQL